MTFEDKRAYSAFAGVQKLASGSLATVAHGVKVRVDSGLSEPIFIFDDNTGHMIEIDLRGSIDDVLSRLQKTGKAIDKKVRPGRPRLGVVSREISLMPRHWEWLATQPGGASAYLRRLVEEAIINDHGRHQVHQARDATFRFVTVMAGNLPGYEESLRAMYASDEKQFLEIIAKWPKDIREHAEILAKPALCLRQLVAEGSSKRHR